MDSYETQPEWSATPITINLPPPKRAAKLPPLPLRILVAGVINATWHLLNLVRKLRRATVRRSS